MDHEWIRSRGVGTGVAVVVSLLALTATALLGFNTVDLAYADVDCDKRNDQGECIFDGGEGGNDPPPDQAPSEQPPVPQERDAWVEEGLASVCGTAGPPGSAGSDSDCMAAHTCPDRTEYRFRVWNRTHTYTAGRWTTGPWRSVGTECRGPDEVDVVTEADVIREVEAFGLRPASARINPANGRTLINLETIFYTTAAEYEFRLANLGPGVDIIATPVEYTWHFGDGHSKVTDKPGRPYPHFDVTHTYAGPATVDVRVDLAYQVQWNAGGGWQTITQTIPGEPGPATPLTVLESRPVLKGR
jgi:hypothetical protein